MDWKDQLAALAGGMEPGPDCAGNENDAATAPQEEAPKGASYLAAKRKGDHIQVVKEKKGRNGKVATIAVGFSGPDEAVAELASVLKRRLGVGGSARGGEILIQGDLQDKVRALLKELLG